MHMHNQGHRKYLSEGLGGREDGGKYRGREGVNGRNKENFHNTLTIKIHFKNDIWIVTYCSQEGILEKVIGDCFLVSAMTSDILSLVF